MDSKTIILFLFLFIFVKIPVSAQIEKPITKKHLLVGGSFGFLMSNSTDTDPDGLKIFGGKIRAIESDLYCGYFLLNRFAIGIKPDFEVKWEELWNNYSKTKTRTFILNSFLRYYFRFGLFGEGTIGIGTSNSWSNSDLWRKREVFSWSLGVGYSIFITNRFAIEPVLSYKSLRETEMVNEKDFRILEGFNFRIGFQIYLKTGKN